MSPQETTQGPALKTEEILGWLVDLKQNPVELTSEDLEGIPDSQMDPELALRQDEDGTPSWWPWSHPEHRNGAKLSPRERREWFADYLSGRASFNRYRVSLRTQTATWRRREIARSLLRIASDFDPAELPTPA